MDVLSETITLGRKVENKAKCLRGGMEHFSWGKLREWLEIRAYVL